MHLTSDGSAFSSAVSRHAGVGMNIKPKYSQRGYIDSELERQGKQQYRKLKKQYKSNRILAYSSILGIILFALSIFHYLSYFG